jgi:NAD(P)H-hydrate epimerase
MKILGTEQVKLADAYTIEHEPILSIDLMERAAQSFVEVFFKDHSPKEPIAVICGPGNNGGDGLAISRLLLDKGFNIMPYVVQTKGGGSDGFKQNLKRLQRVIEVPVITDDKGVPAFEEYKTIVDALFGSGLARPVTGLNGTVIDSINGSNSNIVSVDIPSGLYLDKANDPNEQGAIVQANTSISLQLPKLAFFMPENYKFVGEVKIVDIGLNKNFIQAQESPFSTIEKVSIKSILPVRNKFAHKGTFGHGQLFGGSYGKMGAVSLAAKAFLRSGAGLLTVTIPTSGINIMQTLVPEAMVLEQSGDRHITTFVVSDKADVFGIGPGLGMEKATVKALREFFRSISRPLVLDADALNIISESREMLSLLAPDSFITPHLKEFDRLAGASDNQWQRLEKAREFAKKWQLVIVLKGANTAIIDKSGYVTFNTTGNPGMATAGSGDVLLGIITSLRTQGLAAHDAALAGVYIHGRAGDLAAEEKSMTSLIASDIITTLPQVFIEFLR